MKIVGDIIYRKVPWLRPILMFVYLKLYKKPTFSGWGMTTYHALPFDDDFIKINNTLKQTFEYTSSTNANSSNIDELMWRHWVVTFAVRKALKFAKADYYNLVECGVSDGLSAFFALNTVKSTSFKMHLYDSWNAMKYEHLLDSEKSSNDKYHDLNINRTKKNLIKFKDNVILHQGYIPDILKDDPPPKSIVYLHVDLNSSKATLETLEFFYPLLVKGGVILFDDYAWLNYKDTKDVVDKFFMDKPGILEKLPTGQAIYHHDFLE